jgi:uncharacterized membrane-anchored protein
LDNILNGGFLAGKKTYIVGILAVVGAIATYLTGDTTLTDTIQLVVTAVLGMTIRNGVANS